MYVDVHEALMLQCAVNFHCHNSLSKKCGGLSGYLLVQYLYVILVLGNCVG